MKHLTTMMGTYPKTAGLKVGAVGSDAVALDFAPVETAQKGFKDVVRNLAYDVAELAIITYLLAHEAGKPYVLLPFVMNGQFHHKSILCRSDSDLTPSSLAGKKVAMRSYSQTTPTWVRGILSDEYGVALRDVHWLSQEGAHVAEYEDPPFVTALEPSKSLDDALLAGEVDAVIAGGARAENPVIRTLIPSPAAAAQAWYQRTGVVPINHIVVMRRDIAEAEPETVREVYRMLLASRAAAGEGSPGSGPDLQPTGFKALQASLEAAVRYAYEQELIKQRYPLDELYGPVRAALGATPGSKQGE